MCELLRNAQKLAKKKDLPSFNCPPNVQAICTGTECVLKNIFGDSDTALSPKETVDKFYEGLEEHKVVVGKKGQHD